MANREALNTLFAPHCFVDEGVFLTKKGALGAVYELRGVDFECLADEQMESATQRLHTALRNIDPAFRLYQYIIKEQGAAVAYHRAKEIYTISLYWVLLYEPASSKRGFSLNRGLAISQAAIEAQLEYLYTALNSLVTATGDLLGLRQLDQQQAFRFLRQLSCLDSADASAEHLRYVDHLDYWMGQHAIGVHGRQVYVKRPILPLSLRALPRCTWPNLLRELLGLACEFILCSEFKRIANDAAVKKIMDRQDHFDFTKRFKNTKSAIKLAGNGGKGQNMVADGSAAENVTDLDKTLVRINNGGEFLGEYSLTLILHGADQAGLQQPAAEAINILGNAEGSFVCDTYSALDTYLAIIPGNTANNLRRQWITSANYADLSLVYAPARGEQMNRHLGAEALLVLETAYQTPYFFNLHESDLLGVLIFGIMGSGKSFATNLFIDNTQKYNPFTFILDVGGSYKYLTKKHGGSYLQLSQRTEGFSINPFVLEKNAKNLEFLSSFIHVLLGTSGYEASPAECRLIDKAVVQAERLSSLDLPESLLERLYNWMGDGRYAYLFDNERDTLEIARFQAFDFQGVSDKVIGPLFFYIFQRISQVVYNPANVGRSKQLFCDEAGQFLKTPAARSYFIEAGKTWRKHNGGICLITQSALDLERAGLLDCINEMCPTKILLANPSAKKSFYQQTFELNERELELFSGLIPKQQFLLKTPLKSAVLNVHVDPRASWEYRNDPFSNAKRDKYIAEHGYEKGLDLLAESA